MNLALVRRLSFAAFVAVACVAPAHAQVVYYGTARPVVAAPVAVAPAYVANYTPAGNYAAVTAFSPPVMAEPAAIAVRSGYAPVVAAPLAVTSYYAPAAVAPTVAYYAPPAVAPVVAAPVTTYYAPTYAPAYAPGVLYRRGPLGGYRPVRTAYYIPY